MGDHCAPGKCDCSSSATIDSSDLFSLFLKIDMDNLVCLNELEPGSAKTVFRPWDERLSIGPCVKSDVDEELLFNIPFCGIVRLKKLTVIGPDDSSHPKTVRLFNAKKPLEFDEASNIDESQIIKLSIDTEGALHYPVKQTKFQNLSMLSLHFSDNFGDDSTQINFIGLQGDYIRDFRPELTITSYEIAANPADHKASSQSFVAHGIS